MNQGRNSASLGKARYSLPFSRDNKAAIHWTSEPSWMKCYISYVPRGCRGAVYVQIISSTPTDYKPFKTVIHARYLGHHISVQFTSYEFDLGLLFDWWVGVNQSAPNSDNFSCCTVCSYASGLEPGIWECRHCSWNKSKRKPHLRHFGMLFMTPSTTGPARLIPHRRRVSPTSLSLLTQIMYVKVRWKLQHMVPISTEDKSRGTFPSYRNSITVSRESSLWVYRLHRTLGEAFIAAVQKNVTGTTRSWISVSYLDHGGCYTAPWSWAKDHRSPSKSSLDPVVPLGLYTATDSFTREVLSAD